MFVDGSPVAGVFVLDTADVLVCRAVVIRTAGVSGVVLLYLLVLGVQC